MIVNLITAPIEEPVTVEDIEVQTRLFSQLWLTDENDFVETLITAVREQAEAITRRSLITQVQELVLSAFPSGKNPITIPLPPLQNIVSIKYLDTNNVEQTLNPLSYRTILSTTDYGCVMPLYGLTWPVALNEVDAVKIRFTCGYGPIAPEEPVEGVVYPNNIPKGIIQWIKLNVANLLENRESLVIVDGRSSVIDLSSTLADGLLANYRLYRL